MQTVQKKPNPTQAHNEEIKRQIAALDERHAKGEVTDAEYNVEKARLQKQIKGGIGWKGFVILGTIGAALGFLVYDKFLKKKATTQGTSIPGFSPMSDTGEYYPYGDYSGGGGTTSYTPPTITIPPISTTPTTPTPNPSQGQQGGQQGGYSNQTNPTPPPPPQQPNTTQTVEQGILKTVTDLTKVQSTVVKTVTLPQVVSVNLPSLGQVLTQPALKTLEQIGTWLSVLPSTVQAAILGTGAIATGATYFGKQAGYVSTSFGEDVSDFLDWLTGMPSELPQIGVGSSEILGGGVIPPSLMGNPAPTNQAFSNLVKTLTGSPTIAVAIQKAISPTPTVVQQAAPAQTPVTYYSAPNPYVSGGAGYNGATVLNPGTPGAQIIQTPVQQQQNQAQGYTWINGIAVPNVPAPAPTPAPAPVVQQSPGINYSAYLPGGSQAGKSIWD